MNYFVKIFVLVSCGLLSKNLFAEHEQIIGKNDTSIQIQRECFLKNFASKRAELADLSKKINSLLLFLDDQNIDKNNQIKSSSFDEGLIDNENEEPKGIWEKIKGKASSFFEKIRTWVISKLDFHERKIEKQVQFSLEHFGSKLKTLDFILSEKERKLEESFAALQQQQKSVAHRDEVERAMNDIRSHMMFLDNVLEKGQAMISKIAEDQSKFALRDEMQKNLDDISEEIISKFETKLTTTEALLRAEMDKKINALKGEIISKSVDREREEKNDVSSLIKQAVRKHMNLARDDYRESRESRKRKRIRRLLDELDDEY